MDRWATSARARVTATSDVFEGSRPSTSVIIPRASPFRSSARTTMRICCPGSCSRPSRWTTCSMREPAGRAARRRSVVASGDDGQTIMSAAPIWYVAWRSALGVVVATAVIAPAIAATGSNTRSTMNALRHLLRLTLRQPTRITARVAAKLMQRGPESRRRASRRRSDRRAGRRRDRPMQRARRRVSPAPPCHQRCSGCAAGA